MKLVVIIPALNESATIETVIDRIPRDSSAYEVEVVVVDDGSTDDTVELARAVGAHVVAHGQNRGVGVAFATGVRAALDRGADIIVNMDGDGQFSPEDIPALVAPVLAGEAGFVTCTRFGRKDYIPKMPFMKRWGNAGMVAIINAIIGQRFSDVSCGFRCYSRDTAQRLNLFGRFTYTQESFIALAAQGVVMREVPLRVRGEREHGKSRIASNLFRYALRSSSIIVRALRDHRPLTFFGALAAVTFFVGIGLGGFVLVHYFQTGFTHPYTSVLFGSAAALIVGVLLFVLALVADMLGRMRQTSEAILFELRRLRSDAVSSGAVKPSLPPSQRAPERRLGLAEEREHPHRGRAASE